MIEIRKDSYYIDLGKLGYDKLIGSGSITKKVDIAVEKATDGAMESVKEAGGSVEITAKTEEKASGKKEGKEKAAAEEGQ